MDPNLDSSPPDNSDAIAAFRKPLNDTANRKYRRRSPVSGSLSSDGSPKRERSSSPVISREHPAKISDYRHRRKDDGRELDRDSGRSQYGRRGDSYRHFDRQSSRGSHGYRRHDDYIPDRYAEEEEERNYHKSSSRSGRDTRDESGSYNYGGGEHNRSRDYVRNAKKYPRDKYDGAGHEPKDKEIEDKKYKEKDRDLSSDKTGSGRRSTNSNYDEIIKSGERDKHMRDVPDEKRDHRRCMGDGKSDNTLYHEKSRGHRTESISRKDFGVRRLEEANKSDPKELDGLKHTKQDKRKYDDRHKDRFGRESGERHEDKAHFVSKNQASPSKKSNSFSLDKGADYGKDDDEKWSPSSKQARETVGKVTPEQANANESESGTDLNAAKVAAIKAAELVNRNLVGAGIMSTDQKKKLLWGNKKNTAVEESGHRWDTALFTDRERQEKFKKLMGVKGELKVEDKPENQDGSSLVRAEKEKELQLDLEKQYTAGLRRRDGRTVGLGL